jgi:hypothetical protein
VRLEWTDRSLAQRASTTLNVIAVNVNAVLRPITKARESPETAE